MNNSILIIDDEMIQAKELGKSLKKKIKDSDIEVAYKEDDIIEKIESWFYDIAIIDLRMDEFSFDGFVLIKRVIATNPFARIIIVSAFTLEYNKELLEISSLGKISGIIEKKEYKVFVSELIEVITKINEERISNDTQKDALLEFYKTAKNEPNTYKKGIMFEYFVSLLFAKMGFTNFRNRVIDKSLNETDIIVRNEIPDLFFQKFSPYIFLECKNIPNNKVNKNDFIVFHSKVKNSNGLSNLGIIFSSGLITYNTYLEALRESSESLKIVFISNPEIYRLIESIDILEEFKQIIDSQIKDN